jgi:hypothetical protein
MSVTRRKSRFTTAAAWLPLFASAAWLVPVLPPAALGAQQTRTLSWEPTCRECAVTAEPIMRVSTEREDAGPVQSVWTVSEDGLGRFWASFPGAALVHVYEPDGSTLAQVGRDGEGPGEYRSALALVAVADSMVLFDQVLGRMTVYGPDLRPARTLPFPGNVFRGVALEWPLVAVNGVVPTADAIGYPFHILNIETAAIEHSFGGTGEYTPHDRMGMIGHVAVDPVTGDLWTAFRTRFQVQRWSRDGTLLETWVGLSEWFPEGAFGSVGSPRQRPDGVVTALATGEDGLIRIAVKVPRPDWRDAWPRGSADAPSGPHRSARDTPPQKKLYRNQIAVVNPESGMVLAIQDVSYDTTGPGNIAGGLTALEGLDDYYPALYVLRVSVHRRDRPARQ